MIEIINKNDLFTKFYSQWIKIYKEGSIRDVTLSKYRMTLVWLEKLCPELLVSELNRTTYQQLINTYAVFHEKQTTMDFHHHVKGAILDAIDDGLIERDPTRKAIIKGKTPREKKLNF